MSEEFIEDYEFGKIVIDGKMYSDDVIILGKKVISGWWRDRGHSVNKSDLSKIIEYQPDILIIGTGSSGRVTVPRNLSDKVGFDVQAYPTNKASKKYNSMLGGSKKVAGAFHLTC